MGLTRFPHGIQTPVSTSAPYWLPSEGNVYFVGDSDVASASDNNTGTDYERPLRRISKAMVDKVHSSAGDADGTGDIVFVGTGIYAENVRIIDRDYVRLVGAGQGLTTIKPADTPSSSNTDALGQAQAITLPNQGTAQTNFAFVIGSRGVKISGLSVVISSGTNAATGGFYIGDGTRISSSNNWGASGFHIYDVILDGDASNSRGGWAFCFDGFGPGGIIEHVYATGFRSGAILHNSGTTRSTIGARIRHNEFIGIRGTGVLRPASTFSGNNLYYKNVFADDGTSAMTNGLNFGTNSLGLGDYVVKNSFLCSNTPIVASDAQDRFSANETSTAGNAALTFVSMA